MDPEAQRVVGALKAARLTIATAESLTGGLVAGALTSVPGASDVVLGGVVSYALTVKANVLGVPRSLLQEHGAVAADTALAMADGVRRVTGADVGVATTGVAGPERSEGKDVGTVFIAVTVGRGVSGALGGGESRRHVRALTLQGSREQIRRRTVQSALELLLEVVPGAGSTA